MPASTLDGVLVADFSRVLAGPLAAMTLGDLGADIVKVERPDGGDDTRAWGPPWTDHGATYYLGLNRNKRSIALDLKDPGDRELAFRLATRADVVLESFRPGTMERFGLGRAAIAAANPGVITCTVSAFGSTEAGAALPGYDLLLQAMGGLMSITGEPDGPPLKVGAALIDLVCGLSATIGILAALRARDADPEGRGQHVESTLMDAALHALLNQGSAYLLAGVVGGRLGNRHPSIAPYATYEAADGPFVLAVGNDSLFERLCAVLERPDLPADERFATNAARRQNIEALDARLGEAFARRPAAEWLAALRAAGIPAGPINDIGQAFALAREVGLEPTVAVDGMDFLRSAVRLDRTPPTVRLPPPALDADGAALRAWLKDDRSLEHRPMDAPPLTAERDLLGTIAAGTAGVVGEAFLRTLAQHLATAFDGDVAFVSEFVGERPGHARVLASWPSGVLLELGEYALAGTACELIERQDVLSLSEGTLARYPNDPVVAAHRLDGYLAVVLRGAGGDRLGYVGVMSARRLEATPDELTALSIFAARAAAEVERRRHEEAVRVHEAEVAASRARIVQAADEERRRIGRDLHDGAQQRLVVLGHCIELALRRLDADPDEARRMLEQGREQVVAAGRELRELAQGLHPIRLAEDGLDAALERLAARSPVPLRVVELPDRRLPEALEATVWFLVSEAVTNAAKHARATEVRVEVRARSREVCVVIADDGTGGADPERGTGLHGLADRLATLGGELRVDSPAGAGTRLEAVIPTAPWRTAREPFLEFGHEGDGGEGARLIDMILSARKSASVSLAREWELEGGVPRVGQRLPVMDAAGRRHGVVEVTRVVSLPFGDIDADVVASETGGATTLEAWRAGQRRFWDGCREQIAVLLREPGWRLTVAEPMVVVWFRLVVEP